MHNYNLTVLSNSITYPEAFEWTGKKKWSESSSYRRHSEPASACHGPDPVGCHSTGSYTD